MANNHFVLAAISSVGCLLANAMPAHGADGLPAVASNDIGSSSEVEMRPAPVPLVRKRTATPPSPLPPPPSTVDPTPRPSNAAVEPISGADAAEPLPRQALDGGAAKAAVEADGYKRVTVLGPGPDGTWRVSGFRGNTAVVVTVDPAGGVTTD
jgi:hypothetical protein